MGCGWRLDVLRLGWCGLLFLFFDGLADEDFVYFLALALDILFKRLYFLLEGLLLRLEF